MNKKNSSKKNRAPDWALEPFEQFIEQSQTLLQLMELSTRGISVIKAMPQAVKALNKAKTIDSFEGTIINNKDTSKEIQEIETLAELANNEVNDDFPLLHSQAIVTLWAYLEVSIRDYICRWIKHNKNVYDLEVFKNLKIKLGDYEKLDPEHKIEYIFNLIEQQLAQGEPYGIFRFEKLLKPFGFSGKLNQEITIKINELAQIRNCIVHRAGKIDYQLIEKCPNLKLNNGESLKLSSKDFIEYYVNAIRYTNLLICRVSSHFGRDLNEIEESILNNKACP